MLRPASRSAPLARSSLRLCALGALGALALGASSSIAGAGAGAGAGGAATAAGLPAQDPAAPPADSTDLGSEHEAEVPDVPDEAPDPGGEPAPRRKMKREPPDSPPRTAEDPAPTLLGGADRVEGEERDDVVAFTFDDGPDPHTTPVVLDALAKHKIPAAFFIVNRHIVGHRAAEGLPILARIVADGHLIGGHTANHARLRTLDAEGLQREINDSIAILRLATGKPIELFRPPYGVLGSVAAKRIRKLGLTDVRWSIDPKDFQGDDGDELRRSVLSDITRERGGIVLLHDTKRITAGAIERLLTELERENCRRLDRGTSPILPVSLHYFLQDEGVPRPIPPEVAERTEAYRRWMIEGCAAQKARRASRETRGDAADAASSAAKSRSGHQATRPRRAPRP